MLPISYKKKQKINSVVRLSNHLSRGTDHQTLNSYLNIVKKWGQNEPVIFIDDSDIVKPDGKNSIIVEGIMVKKDRLLDRLFAIGNIRSDENGVSRVAFSEEFFEG